MFDVAAFKALFPAFDGVDDSVVLAVAGMGECYINKCGDCSDQLWQLLTAHMLKLRAAEAAGDTVGSVASASVDGVSVSYTAPPSTQSGATYWYGLTPYGQQYLVLAKRCGGIGFYAGGSGERAAFRGAGGRFPLGGRTW